MFVALHIYSGPQHVEPDSRVELARGPSLRVKGTLACKILYSNFRQTTFYEVGSISMLGWTSVIAVPDVLIKVLSAFSGMLGAVRSVAAQSTAVGGDKVIDEVLQLPHTRQGVKQ